MAFVPSLTRVELDSLTPFHHYFLAISLYLQHSSPMYSAHLSISASFQKTLSCLSIIPVVWIAFLRFVTPDLFMHLICSMLFPLFLNIALQASSLWLFCIPVSPVDSSYRKCGCSWLFYIFCAHHIYDIELIQGVKCFSSQLLAKHCLLP